MTQEGWERCARGKVFHVRHLSLARANALDREDVRITK
jgi:hypothetical protein